MAQAQYPFLDYLAAALFLGLALWMVIRLLSRIEQVPLDQMTQQAKHGITVFGILALYALARCIVCLLSAWSVISENGTGLRSTLAIMAPTLLFLALQTRFIRKWSVHVRELKMVTSRGSTFPAGPILINISFSMIFCCLIITIIYCGIFWSPTIYHGGDENPSSNSSGNNTNSTLSSLPLLRTDDVLSKEVNGIKQLRNIENVKSNSSSNDGQPESKIHLALTDLELGRLLQGIVGVCYLVNGVIILFLGLLMKYISRQSGGHSYVDSIRWALNRLLIITLLFGSCCAIRGLIKIIMFDAFWHPNGPIANFEQSHFATTIILLFEWLAVTFSLAILTYTPNVKKLQSANNLPDDGPYGRNHGSSGRDQGGVLAGDDSSGGNNDNTAVQSCGETNTINASPSTPSNGSSQRGSTNQKSLGLARGSSGNGSNSNPQRSFGISIEETLLSDSLPGAAHFNPDLDFYKPKNATSCHYQSNVVANNKEVPEKHDHFDGGNGTPTTVKNSSYVGGTQREKEPLLNGTGGGNSSRQHQQRHDGHFINNSIGHHTSITSKSHWRNSYNTGSSHSSNIDLTHHALAEHSPSSHFTLAGHQATNGGSTPYVTKGTSGLTSPISLPTVVRLGDGSALQGREKAIGSPLRTPSGAGLTVNKK